MAVDTNLRIPKRVLAIIRKQARVAFVRMLDFLDLFGAIMLIIKLLDHAEMRPDPVLLT